MKTLKFLTLGLIALSGIASTARADWWGHRHYRHDHVVVAPGPVIAVDIGYRRHYYVEHHRSLDADVQVALARRGYYHGPIDGDIGPGSIAAIRAYQYDRGLPVTGMIDGPLIRSLGI
jgi:hypothetical protein